MPVSLEVMAEIIEEDQHKYHLSPAIRSEIDSFLEKSRSLKDLVESTFFITEDLEIRISSDASVSEKEGETDMKEEFDYIIEKMILLQGVIHGCRTMELRSTRTLTESPNHTSGHDLYEIERRNSTVIMADEAETEGHIALFTGNYTEAINHYTGAINLFPSDHFLYLLRSEAHYSLDQFSEALSDAKKVVQLKPDLIIGYINIGYSYSELQNYKDAISAFEKALEIDPDDNELMCEISNVKGMLASSTSDFVETIKHFTDAINLYPTSHKLYYNRSLAHTNFKQLFEALSDAQKAVQLEPDWIGGYYRLGDAYFDLENYNGAVYAYEKGLEIDPTNDNLKMKIMNAKGDAVAFFNGNFFDDIQHCTDAIDSDPSKSEHIIDAEYKGYMALSIGNYIDAIKYYADAINLFPSDYSLYSQRSEAYYSLEQFSEALSDAKKIVQLKPDLSIGYIHLGNSYSKLNNYEDAISAYEKALEVDPDNDCVRSDLSHILAIKGRLAFSCGKFVEAIQHYTDAINLYPTNHVVYFKSIAHTNLKQLFEALFVAQTIVQLKPNWIEGYCRLGDAYCNLKNYNDAVSAYEKGLEIDPTNNNLKRKILCAKGTVKWSTDNNIVDAIHYFTERMILYPLNHIIYESRSESHASLNQFSKAMSDAQKTILLDPGWDGGYLRLGDVYLGLGIYNDAVSTYRKGLEIYPTNKNLNTALTIAKAAWATRKGKTIIRSMN